MPDVSANRDRAVPFRGDRHYFHRPTGVRRWRGRLTLLAGLAAVGWVAAEAARPDRRYAAATHGPLVRAHAAWDARCDACHVPHGEPGCGSDNPLACRERWRAFRCDGCHPGPAGDEKNYAPHYMAGDRLKADPLAQDCSSCHRDHQGRDASLVRVADAACLRCHQDLRPLGSHMPPVSAFHSGHPEFRALAAPQPPDRPLKFNHALHLAAGLRRDVPAEKPNSKTLFTLQRVSPGYQDQYARYTSPPGTPTAHVRLDCAACHQLDAGREVGAAPGRLPGLPAEPLSPPKPAGAYFLPVVYERHCQGCHPPTVSDLVSDGGVRVPPFDVPHWLQPATLHRVLEGEIARRLFGPGVPARDNPLVDGVRGHLPAAAGAQLDQLMDGANGLLYQTAPGQGWVDDGPTPNTGYGCRLCHHIDPGVSPGVLAQPAAQFLLGGSAAEFRIRPTAPPGLYLPNGRFDHSAHRMVTCASCHDVTAAQPVPRRWDLNWTDEPLHLPGIDTCRKCHAPSDTVHGQPVGGVRYGCVDCHRYHATDHPLQGPGSPAREPARRLDVGEFLGGARRPGGDR